MFGIDVRVHPMFWVVSLLMGWSFNQLGFGYVILWIVCVFVSILIHELGHVVAGLAFGSRGHIVLYSFGGLAIGSADVRTRWQRIAVLFAGPLAGFLFLVFLFLVLKVIEPPRAEALVGETGYYLGIIHPFDPKYLETNLANYALYFLVQINLFWGLVNLLPVFPLDGGQISRELFNWAMPGRGIRPSLGLSIAVAGLMCLNSLAAYNGHPLIPKLPAGGLYTAFLFGLLALSNFMELQQTNQSRSRGSWGDDRAPWERDPDYWKR
jgi:membrane-associated protease RseP (regulator of RpoE activity)